MVLLAAQGHAHEQQATAAKDAAARKSPLPVRKSGLWEVTLRDDTPGPRMGQTVRMCTNAESEPVMLMAIVPGQEDCHEIRATRRAKGVGYDIRTVCYVHDNRVETRMELTGDLLSAYEGRFSVKFSLSSALPPAPTVFEGRWLGACQPGQRPGDMVLPNGVTVNVVDDRKRAESAHEDPDHSGHGHKH
jgi:hypothetical protein